MFFPKTVNSVTRNLNMQKFVEDENFRNELISEMNCISNKVGRWMQGVLAGKFPNVPWRNQSAKTHFEWKGGVKTLEVDSHTKNLECTSPELSLLSLCPKPHAWICTTLMKKFWGGFYGKDLNHFWFYAFDTKHVLVDQLCPGLVENGVRLIFFCRTIYCFKRAGFFKLNVASPGICFYIYCSKRIWWIVSRICLSYILVRVCLWVCVCV